MKRRRFPRLVPAIVAALICVPDADAGQTGKLAHLGAAMERLVTEATSAGARWEVFLGRDGQPGTPLDVYHRPDGSYRIEGSFQVAARWRPAPLPRPRPWGFGPARPFPAPPDSRLRPPPVDHSENLPLIEGEDADWEIEPPLPTFRGEFHRHEALRVSVTYDAETGALHTGTGGGAVRHARTRSTFGGSRSFENSHSYEYSYSITRDGTAEGEGEEAAFAPIETRYGRAYLFPSEKEARQFLSHRKDVVQAVRVPGGFGPGRELITVIVR